jgi:hypothetical protein
MEFVAFEIAKKLKDLGYNTPFFFFYRTDDQLIHHAMVSKPLVYGENVDNEVVIAPTTSQVLKWLREEKKIFVVIAVNPTFATKDKIAYYYNVYFNSDGVTICHYESEEGYAQWEDCAIDSIKYILDNLI